jgi:hypothetical protein
MAKTGSLEQKSITVKPVPQKSQNFVSKHSNSHFWYSMVELNRLKKGVKDPFPECSCPEISAGQSFTKKTITQ